MSFISFNFYLFLAITIVVYYLVPKRYQWIVLLAASYGFYIFASVPALLFMVVTTLTTFYSAQLIGLSNKRYTALLSGEAQEISREQRKQLKAQNKRKNSRILLAALLINFGILAFVKYYNFLGTNLNSLLSFLSLDAALPGL